jgi:hypothetical protein
MKKGWVVVVAEGKGVRGGDRWERGTRVGCHTILPLSPHARLSYSILEM